ncbi:nucleoside deaminase [Cryptosporangium arvum]|uniref:Cytosine/adenosine deaminase n=1 Tax=Cryptosporangium arvum DSM 44712 TaxID=927661 RepID=A0A011AER4_9ACTN|nr:nucleoside deaminase [Cryptosporangium arvum]EXG80531.1 cytosine/adenosine deaminase [Cryptosporangium arvum DSM 44712]
MDPKLLGRAVDLATQNAASGQLPFGALLVRDGEVLATGVNTVLRDLDPAAHAEVEAVRAACRNLGTLDLRGAEIYSSCEPCPMCCRAAQATGIAVIWYAAQATDIPDLGYPVPAPDVFEARHATHAEATAPFARYLNG